MAWQQHHRPTQHIIRPHSTLQYVFFTRLGGCLSRGPNLKHSQLTEATRKSTEFHVARASFTRVPAELLERVSRCSSEFQTLERVSSCYLSSEFVLFVVVSSCYLWSEPHVPVSLAEIRRVITRGSGTTHSSKDARVQVNCVPDTIAALLYQTRTAPRTPRPVGTGRSCWRRRTRAPVRAHRWDGTVRPIEHAHCML